ncbi:polysaccharide deacetylase family protein [Brevibacillus ginsengisoli]|uniref:polysaccharide deacetylase family protein n=1 Tax=Brevibacillus ginsengisoli TaxID=363854 RepID=UPI003CF6D19B
MLRMQKKLLLACVSGLIVGLLFFYSNSVNQYISVMKSAVDKVNSRSEGSLREKIENWKKIKDEQPIDAYVDRIWKAIPGYNGREVDVKASLKHMSEHKLDTEKGLIFREVPPSVTLEQLGAYPIYRGNPKKPAVSFMINVAWGNEFLDRMLDTLDKYQIKTTFFLDGSWVKKYPELARKIKDRGHEIANHAYSHPDMAQLGAERIQQEIGKTQDIIEQTTGVKPTLFAPPSGSFSDQVVQIARNGFHMKTILWTADTVDWQKPSASTVIERIEPKLDNGVLVLMHPTQASSDALEALIKIAKKRRLTITTVSEVISSNRMNESY